MKMNVNRSSIRIIPENEEDIAYIEDTLHLNRQGAYLKLTRMAVHGLPSSLAYLETGKDTFEDQRPA
jgi:vacuolar-type H+-ATPase subunit D/Vma8